VATDGFEIERVDVRSLEVSDHLAVVATLLRRQTQARLLL
jgi:hypothetical protein